MKMELKALEAHIISIPLRKLHVDYSYLLPAIVLGAFIIFISHWTSSPELPIINPYPFGFNRRKLRETFNSNAKSLLAEGLKKFNGPFRITTLSGPRVVLPASYAGWAKDEPGLDFQEFMVNDLFGKYPGMDGLNPTADSSHIAIEMIKTKLNQNSQYPIMHDNAAEVIDEIWKDRQDWNTSHVASDILRFVSRVSAAILVGPELSRDPDWQDITTKYAGTVFSAGRTLRDWPAFLRPFVHWFLPEWKTIRLQVSRARKIINSLIEQRKAEKIAAEREGRTCKFDDSIEWARELSKGAPYDAVAMQLGLSVAALYTTTDMISQTLLDICSHPELIEPLRDEMKHALQESGWTTAGLYKMQLLDSVMKESQRMKPVSMVMLGRKALQDVFLPNGVRLPKGTSVVTEISVMEDEAYYPDPSFFDGYRYLKLRKNGDTTAQMVSLSPKHIGFGLGKHACPGRFFAVAEAKIILTHILLNYDVRLTNGPKPSVISVGFERLSDVNAKIEVRRRSSSLDGIC